MFGGPPSPVRNSRMEADVSILKSGVEPVFQTTISLKPTFGLGFVSPKVTCPSLRFEISVVDIAERWALLNKVIERPFVETRQHRQNIKWRRGAARLVIRQCGVRDRVAAEIRLATSRVERPVACRAVLNLRPTEIGGSVKSVAIIPPDRPKGFYDSSTGTSSHFTSHLRIAISFPCSHLAPAAFLAISARCSGVKLAARAFPPLRPPLRPSSTAAGSFSDGLGDSGRGNSNVRLRNGRRVSRGQFNDKLGQLVYVAGPLGSA